MSPEPALRFTVGILHMHQRIGELTAPLFRIPARQSWMSFIIRVHISESSIPWSCPGRILLCGKYESTTFEPMSGRGNPLLSVLILNIHIKTQ